MFQLPFEYVQFGALELISPLPRPAPLLLLPRSTRQRAVPVTGYEMQQVRLRGDKGNEPNVSLFGAFGGRGEPEGLPQDHAAAQVCFEAEHLRVCCRC